MFKLYGALGFNQDGGDARQSSAEHIGEELIAQKNRLRTLYPKPAQSVPKSEWERLGRSSYQCYAQPFSIGANVLSPVIRDKAESESQAVGLFDPMGYRRGNDPRIARDDGVVTVEEKGALALLPQVAQVDSGDIVHIAIGGQKFHDVLPHDAHGFVVGCAGRLKLLVGGTEHVAAVEIGRGNVEVVVGGVCRHYRLDCFE